MTGGGEGRAAGCGSHRCPRAPADRPQTLHAPGDAAGEDEAQGRLGKDCPAPPRLCRSVCLLVCQAALCPLGFGLWAWGGAAHSATLLPLQKGPRSENSKSNKIFVGGIPHNCGETELREYFKKFGVVSAPSLHPPQPPPGPACQGC